MKVPVIDFRLTDFQRRTFHRLHRLGLTLALSVLSSTASVAAENPNTLNDISFVALPGDRVQITMSLSEAATKPGSFAMDNPARIALDFQNTRSALEKRSQTVGVGMVRSITAVEAGGRTRVVLNLVTSIPFETRVDGNQVHLILDGAGQSGFTSAAASPLAAAVSSSAGGSETIRDIDFRRGPAGEGRILITLGNPNTVVDMREEGGKVVLEMLDSVLPDRLARRLDVTDFATPVTMVDTFATANNVRMTVTAAGEYDYLSYQADDLFTIEFKPVTKEEKAAARKQRMQYTGERLSLNFQNIEVRAVLQLLADFTGLNMVTSDSVGGSLTLRLKNVPWDQALDLILKTKGLSKRQNGNVMLVAPTEEIAAREKLELESQQQIEELAPLRAEFIQINYAKASDMAALLKSPDNQLLSERGNITLDERTNILLVQDTASKLEEIRKLVSRLDIPVRQVLVDSRIVIANNDFAKDLGVKFGFSTRQTPGSNTLRVGGGVRGDRDQSGDTGGAPIVPVPSTTDLEGLITDLPVSGASGAINFILARASGHLLRLELSAMQEEGRGEIISSPRVITSDQHKATIKQGTEIPYQQASSSGATSTAFKEAVLKLDVTPHITPDDRIIMDLQINQDRPDFSNALNNVPPVNTQQITTRVLVDNGETVVLGGVYEQTKSYASERVPFFGDLPLLGVLFRDKREVDDTRELLIFVTPKILKESLTLN